MFAVDTNIFVYAYDARSPGHRACLTLVQGLQRQAAPWHTTWGVLYEFLRVATHPRVFERPMRAAQAWETVAALLTSPGLEVLIPTSRHVAVAQATIADLPDLAGNGFHDAHVAILMREHGVRRICTHDAGFRRFPFLEVVDPLIDR